jgi:TonB-linked SusC/RagA family outer membrane protein
VLRRLPATTLVVAIGALLAPASPSGATAQAASPSAVTSLLERPARLRVRDATLADALGELERRSGVSLAYSPSLLTNKRVQRCACADVTVAGALAELLADTPFTFRESSGEIVIVPIALPDESAAIRTPIPTTETTGALGLVMPAASSAIDSATVTGRVTTDAGTPIGAAVVSIPSLRLSATTNDAGVYVIPIPSDRFVARSDSLRVTRIGYRPATVRFTMQSGRVTVDVTMSAQAVSLEQVVVTGTAGNQERRAQAAVVSTIDASEITSKAPVLDVNELLYARTPGVSMTKGSGTSGSNTRIDIRGQASISLSNYPLVFIDGVRVTAGPRSVVSAPGGTTAGAGGQQLNALNDLNPDDIESIEIVKGPAASTLYGSDASAGVIQILTKKGRLGSEKFTQTITTEYDKIDPNFTPYAAYGACTAALVAANSPNPLCRGKAVGTVVSDNVLTRNDVFDNGLAGSLQYTMRGGNDAFGFYGSFGTDYERGTTPSSYLKHRSGRLNATWNATPKIHLEISAPLSRIDDRLPQGDQSSLGFLLGGILGSPLSVTEGTDGKLAGGWFNNNVTVDAIGAINTSSVTTRTTPSVQGSYAPFAWFTNRLTLGADLVRTNASQFYPKNEKNWYSAVANTGSIAVNEQYTTIYTVDYLGNLSHTFGSNGSISSNLSFGSQWINTSGSAVQATGQGLVANSNNLVSAATTTAAGQQLSQQISFGFFAQEQIGFKDRLFVQLGGRADRNSAFNKTAGTFFLPKAGVSYVISEEPFWSGLSNTVSTLRLRAAYGATGRSPGGTTALQTYTRAPFVTDAGVVQPGVTPGNPGNPDLKPERGTEFEAGFDAGFLRDRVGLELTYFDKRSKDLLLQLPLAPSSGFASSPFVNIGEVKNSGFEIGVRATPVSLRNFSWDANLNVNTLSNEIVSMGSITPFISNNQCFKPGVEVAGWCVPQVLSVDTIAGRATVSDTAQFVGGNLPKYGGAFSSTLTLFRRVRLYGLVDGKFDYNVYNLTKDFRDRSLGNSAEVRLAAADGGYSAYERLRRLGPFRAANSGATVGNTLVRGPYIEEGDYIRFRELSLTLTLPESWTRAARVGAASISVGGKNLALWKKSYTGWDPEVMGTVDVTTPFLGDVFTTPQSRRAFARLTVQF